MNTEAITKLVMDTMLAHAAPEERTYQVCVDHDGQTLYADTANGELGFFDDKATMFTEPYAKWLCDSLNGIRDEKGVTKQQINFYIRQQL